MYGIGQFYSIGPQLGFSTAKRELIPEFISRPVGNDPFQSLWGENFNLMDECIWMCKMCHSRFFEWNWSKRDTRDHKHFISFDDDDDV